MKKRWQEHPRVSDEILRQFPELHPLVVQLLHNRGLTTQEQVDEFLNPDYEDLHDPMLFTDMAAAVDRILKAVDAKEKIVVHGDYDSDGVCSATLLLGVLRDLGAVSEVYLPHREKEGYGLNVNTVNALAEQHVKLIITVDCGISNAKEVAVAKERGIDVIITDHHAEPPELPQALAIINPAVSNQGYPFQKLAGVGVAFKVAQALVRRVGDRLPAGYEKWLLDVVALATVTDMMPLIGENRTLVKYGLIVMQKTKRVGLKMLMQRAGIMLTPHEIVNTTHLGFALGPRINASGRINHANTSFELLNSTDETAAIAFVEELEKNNQERQKITQGIIEEVMASVDEKNLGTIIIARGKTWPMGIVGLVASKVKDAFNRPTFVLTENAGKIVGSGRSVSDFNMIEALQKISKHFSHYGGHKAACGMTLASADAYDDFVKDVTALADEALAGKELLPVLHIDAELTLKQANWELFEDLEKFQPFGIANPTPHFVFRNCTVDAVKLVGTEGQHVRMVVRDGTVLKGLVGIAFRQGEQGRELRVGDRVDVVATVDVNEWNGRRDIQLVVQDFKKVEQKNNI